MNSMAYDGNVHSALENHSKFLANVKTELNRKLFEIRSHGYSDYWIIFSFSSIYIMIFFDKIRAGDKLNQSQIADANHYLMKTSTLVSVNHCFPLGTKSKTVASPKVVPPSSKLQMLSNPKVKPSAINPLPLSISSIFPSLMNPLFWLAMIMVTVLISGSMLIQNN